MYLYLYRPYILPMQRQKVKLLKNPPGKAFLRRRQPADARRQWVYCNRTPAAGVSSGLYIRFCNVPPGVSVRVCSSPLICASTLLKQKAPLCKVSNKAGLHIIQNWSLDNQTSYLFKIFFRYIVPDRLGNHRRLTDVVIFGIPFNGLNDIRVQRVVLPHGLLWFFSSFYW